MWLADQVLHLITKSHERSTFEKRLLNKRSPKGFVFGHNWDNRDL